MNFTFKIGEKIKEAWSLYKEHFTTLLIVTIATFVVAGVGQKDNNILAIIVMVVNILLSYIWIRLIFNIIDKKEFNLFSKEALPTLGQLWNFFKTSLLYALCVITGFVLLIIPGFYVLGRLMFAIYLSVEKNQGARVSIKESWEMTRGYGWLIFWKSFVIGLFIVLGFIALFIGSFVTYPIGFMVMIMMYREFVKFKSQTPANSNPIEVVKDLPKETPVDAVVIEEVK
jgi:uncharacterized membrane protein